MTPRDDAQPKPTDRDQFIQHLKHASETVSTWPSWKQNLLGDRRQETGTYGFSNDSKPPRPSR